MRILAIIISLSLLGCASQKQQSDSSREKPKSLFAKEMNPAKSATAVDANVETEMSKDDSVIIKERFRNAYNSTREENMVSAASDILVKNPDDPIALKALGLFYVKMGKPDAARIFFGRVLEKDPKNPDINNTLGMLAMNEDKFVEAQRFFKLALQGDDDHVQANYNLGTYYLKYKDYDKALRFLKIAYEKNSKDMQIANNFAIALRGVGDYDKALSVYKSIDAKGQKPAVLLNQAILLAEYKKDYKEAKEVLNKIRFITTDPLLLKKVNQLVKLVEQK